MNFYLGNATKDTLDEKLCDKLAGYRQQFIEAMEDDLNTADALAAIFELVREINISINAATDTGKQTISWALELLKELTSVLGIMAKEQEYRKDDKVEALVEERQKARANKDFKRADEIRDQLKSMGIELQDTPQGLRLSTNRTIRLFEVVPFLKTEATVDTKCRVYA